MIMYNKFVLYPFVKGEEMKKIIDFANKEFAFEKSTKIAILFGLWAFSGIYGFIYEFIFYYFNGGMKQWYWRGGCFGPWIVIYGLGSIAIYLMTLKIKKNPLAVLLTSGIVCGLIEGLTGAFFYYCMDGKRNWDYNTEILNWGNINGFVCFRSVAIFAISGVMLVYLILPVMYRIADKANKKAFNIIAIGIGVLFIIDVVYNTVLAPKFGWFTANQFYSNLGLGIMDF